MGMQFFAVFQVQQVTLTGMNNLRALAETTHPSRLCKCPESVGKDLRISFERMHQLHKKAMPMNNSAETKSIIRRCCIIYLVFEIEGLRSIVFLEFKVYDFRILTFSKSQLNIQSNRGFDLASNKGFEVILPWTKVKGLVTECYQF